MFQYPRNATGDAMRSKHSPELLLRMCNKRDVAELSAVSATPLWSHVPRDLGYWVTARVVRNETGIAAVRCVCGADHEGVSKSTLI